jgi:hypothetical protein
MRKLTSRLLPFADPLVALFVYPCALLLKNVRRAGVQNLRFCRQALIKTGAFPIQNHYHEPQFDFRGAKQAFSQERILPGIDWNITEQLGRLDALTFSQELVGMPQEQGGPLSFSFENATFKSGDAEYWYQLIRAVKPKRIFEIGSGNSTLLAHQAILKNHEQDPLYACKHVCIEPYEAPWLEKTGATVVRKRIEDVGIPFFSELEENDVLFIDSSHIIRPQGDVLFEYLELLPTLNKGVIIHIHDIFSPRNYPREWLEEYVLFWNEQYLLEAFLSHNTSWKIIGALNMLHHSHYDSLRLVAPFLTPDREPGSFYIQKA